MANFINLLSEANIPFWGFIAAPAVLILLIIFVLWFVHTRIFKRRFKKVIDAKDADQAKEAIKRFERHYPAKKLMRYSKRMERYSRQMGPQVVRETGLADKWVQKLTSSSLPTASDLRRVLLYCPPSSLFKAYLAAEKYPRLRRAFTAWMQKEGEEKVIRLLAESCRGEDFEPVYGKTFLANNGAAGNGALLRELTAEPEWFARYFAYKILLHDTEAVSERSMEDGLADPHSLVRKILVQNFSAGREKIWNMLWDKLIHDPVFEVREAARNRITKEFMDMYDLKDKTLNDTETMRVLELLDPACQEDRTFAMIALESKSGELRYPAAAFLDKCGVLSDLLSKNTLDDFQNIVHCVDLFLKALQVNVCGFLKDYPSGDGAPLLVASRLLTATGRTGENIYQLGKKVFAFFTGRKLEPSVIEIYTNTVEAVSSKGNIKSYELLAEELSRRENDAPFLNLLLPKIPGQAEALFSPILFRFLENPSFPARQELEKTIGSFSPETVLPDIMRILNGSRADYPHAVRISSLKILAMLHLPFCIQKVLESLPTIKIEEIEEFAELISGYPQEMFEEKASLLLASPDARIRASLISILPAVKNDSFMKEVRSSLKDVDPDVRVAAIKALLGFGEIKLLNQETSMLHDPVERVRFTTAEVIARHGSTAALEVLKGIIEDKNETDTVKIGIIMGLGQAVNAEGIPILVNVLDTMEEFREYAEKALSARTAKRDINKLVEIFKDAEPPLREKLIPVFKAYGKEAEPIIVEILKDEVASIKPYLVQILEETGFVDKTKKRLLDRKVEVRRETAYLLALLDTLPAFRGLVLAAKDPDQEVRVCVVKALEKLKSEQSRGILEKLKEDPDSRVRKYTYWALERLDSLKME